MLIIISPAKTLDFKVRDVSEATLPLFADEAALLANDLKAYSPGELSKLMGISSRLAELNADRYTVWNKGDHKTKGKVSVLAYKGDVYQGLQADMFTEQEMQYAQKHLRIISGLYGVLRPLDLILPYRLEMGTRFNKAKFETLYSFWTEKITKHLSNALKDMQSNTLINLASDEYFKAIDLSKLKASVVTPVFKDFKNGQYKFISFFAKKARGAMARFIINNGILDIQELKLFNSEGYLYNDHLSDKQNWVFTRD